VAIDVNFRLKRKDVSSEEKDPGLGNGWAFYCEVLAYMQHVKRNWNQKQDVRFLFPFFLPSLEKLTCTPEKSLHSARRSR
jgi:hypothetical protein